SGAHEGTSVTLGVPNVPTYESDDEQISSKSSEEEDDDEENFSTHDDEAMQDKEVNEEDNFDPRVQTPSHVESTDDEDSDYSSSVSSGFISNMLNPSPDTGIDIIFTLNNEATLPVDVLVTTIVEPPLLFATTLPQPPTPLITHLQQTPVSVPATVPSSSLQDLP
ncbi:hypothetical protein Tco_1347655, partial [Tanacetum coccineum]